MVEEVRDEYYKLTEELRKVLEDKEKEIRLAKKVAVREYRNSDALLFELRVSYGDDFDEDIRQVKVLYPAIDLSSININAPELTSARLAQSEDTNELFGENPPVTAQGDQQVVESDPKDGQARRIEEKETTNLDEV